MNWKKLLVSLLAVAVLYVAWSSFGWQGIALAGGALVMWLLLHFNRLMHVLNKAVERPKGYVGSAVMLNARLKPGDNLLRVMAMTESIGEALSPEGEQPEIFRWTDGTQSSVTCEFVDGKLVKWELVRPGTPVEETPAPAP